MQCSRIVIVNLAIKLCSKWTINKETKLHRSKRNKISGAQLEIFYDRGGFVELRYFDKLFFKGTKKKAPQEKILELFLLDTLKTIFWIEHLTQGWTQLGPFFPKSGHSFQFSKKGRGGPPSPPSCAPKYLSKKNFHMKPVKKRSITHHLEWKAINETRYVNYIPAA